MIPNECQARAMRPDHVPMNGMGDKAIMVPPSGLAPETRTLRMLLEGRVGQETGLFDGLLPIKEQLPREFRIQIEEVLIEDRVKVAMRFGDVSFGDPLTDNSYEEDGYRYHDVFHLAYAAVLGWSPVVRKLMGRKRKSEPRVDEVEDGARAIALEEGICALVFEHAKDYGYLDGVDHLDGGILRTIKQLTRNLEVSVRSEYQWQEAIVKGFAVWRQFRFHRRGIVVGNLLRKTIDIELYVPQEIAGESTSNGISRPALID